MHILTESASLLNLIFIITFILPNNNQAVGQSSGHGVIDIGNTKVEFLIKKEDTILKEFINSDPERLALTGDEFFKAWDKQFGDSKEILLYFHSLYGDAPIFKSIAHSKIQKSLLDHSSAKLLIVKWGTWNPFYGKNQEIALEKGKMLSSILIPFHENGYRIHSLHHSMGSKLLEGMLSDIEDNNILSQVFLVAPDLDSAFIQRDSQLIADHIEDLHIFYSPNDLVLGLAEIINENKRLGNMKGILRFENIHFYDTREFDCILNNNHLNWLTCPRIGQIIQENLEGNTNE